MQVACSATECQQDVSHIWLDCWSILQAALFKIGMLEDMDVQLRSQLEKIVAQRNQLGAEKAARNIEARSCDHQYSYV